MRWFPFFALPLMVCSMVFGAPGKIDPSKRVLLVTAFEPIVFGQKIGWGTLFANSLAAQGPIKGVNPMIVVSATGIMQSLGNDGWYAQPGGFDVNGLISDTAKTVLGPGKTLMDGQEAGVLGNDIVPLGIMLNADSLAVRKGRLDALAREKQVDVIVMLHSSVAMDWMQKSGCPVFGIGHLYTHFDCVYCVLSSTVYDCKTGKFSDGPVVKHARRALGVDWHPVWDEYPAGEQRAFLREMEVVLREAVPVLIGELGLANGPVGPLPTRHVFLHDGEEPRTFIPDGDEIVLPAWATAEGAREVVRKAFAEREWTVAEETDGLMKGIHRKKKKHAVCSVMLSKDKMVIRSEGFRVQDDGSLKPAEPYKSWHENMKESIMIGVMQMEGRKSENTAASPSK